MASGHEGGGAAAESGDRHCRSFRLNSGGARPEGRAGVLARAGPVGRAGLGRAQLRGLAAVGFGRVPARGGPIVFPPQPPSASRFRPGCLHSSPTRHARAPAPGLEAADVPNWARPAGPGPETASVRARLLQDTGGPCGPGRGCGEGAAPRAAWSRRRRRPPARRRGVSSVLESRLSAPARGQKRGMKRKKQPAGRSWRGGDDARCNHRLSRLSRVVPGPPAGWLLKWRMGSAVAVWIVARERVGGLRQRPKFLPTAHILPLKMIRQHHSRPSKG